MGTTKKQSGQARKWEKFIKVLAWIEAWHVTDVHNIMDLLGITEKNAYLTIRAMQELGLIQRYKLAAHPVTLIGITTVGLDHLKHHYKGVMPRHRPPTSASKMPRNAAHDLIAQTVFLEVKRRNQDQGLKLIAWESFKGEHRQHKLMPQNTSLVAVIPDATLTVADHDGNQWVSAIEVQETRENNDTAERRIGNYIALQQDGIVYDVIWATTSPVIYKQISTLLNGEIHQFETEVKRVTNRLQVQIWTKDTTARKLKAEDQECELFGALRKRYYHTHGETKDLILI